MRIGFEARPTVLDRVADGRHEAVVVFQKAFRLVIEQVAQLRHAAHDGQDLVHLFVVLGDGDHATGIVEHVTQLIGNRIGIDRNGNRAERLRGEKGPV